MVVSDGQTETNSPFLVIVKSDAPAGNIPKAPVQVTAERNGNQVTLGWEIPAGDDLKFTVIYWDGIPRMVLPADVTAFVDQDLLPGTHTRYAVSFIDQLGAESFIENPKNILHRLFDD